MPVLLDELEQAAGPADPVPSSDGWELVLAENVAYLVEGDCPSAGNPRPLY